jgi:hypothetical protein
MRALLLTAAVGLAVLSTSAADGASTSGARGSQCFKRDEISGFARHDARSALVRVDKDRVFPLTAVGDCALLAKATPGSRGRIGRAQLVSRTRDWFCAGDTADLLPWNTTGDGRCAVTIGSEQHR